MEKKRKCSLCSKNSQIIFLSGKKTTNYVLVWINQKNKNSSFKAKINLISKTQPFTPKFLTGTVSQKGCKDKKGIYISIFTFVHYHFFQTLATKIVWCWKNVENTMSNLQNWRKCPGDWWSRLRRGHLAGSRILWTVPVQNIGIFNSA